MALTLTVETAVDGVRIDATVPAGKDRVTVARTGPSNTPAGVRGWTEATVVPGPLIVRDFEAPIGVPLTYTVTYYVAATGPGAGTVETASVTITTTGVCDTWLTDLVRPANTLRVVIESLVELSYEVPATVHWVLSRRPPIVSSDVAHTPTFDLQVLTDTLDQRDQTKALLGNGVPVLLRTPPQDGIGNLYLSVLGFHEQRLVTPGDAPFRRFVISGVQVERPDPILYVPLSPTTYATVKATFATYADLKAQRATYDALAFDYTGTTAGDVVPWPPDDV